MKNRKFFILFLLLFFNFNVFGKVDNYHWLKKSIDISLHQLLSTATELSDSLKFPRSTWTVCDLTLISQQLNKEIKSSDTCLKKVPLQLKGKRRLCDIYDWTSGFFPGSLWYLYDLTKDETVKNQAIKYTKLLYPIKYYKGTHDIGFMMLCSYGNAYRITINDTILPILIQTANNLAGRFDDKIGCIRSWDFGKWKFPVIIDNMMNLELLYFATNITKNPYYKNIAIKHADTTLKNHFRSDASSYHLVSYNPDGSVEIKQTFQGKNDSSKWARGQAWALYGYTVCYRETSDKTYLMQAQKIADMIMKEVSTKDLIPFWDYDAPNLKNTPRDASAAAITASALFELCTYLPDKDKYFSYAETILKNLSSNKYIAKKGSNQGFILKHSTGSLPHCSEIDTPINYADYYYLEAIKRYMNLKQLTYQNLK